MKRIAILLLLTLNAYCQPAVGHSSFMPEVGHYIVSGWVREIHTDAVRTYESSSIEIKLFDVSYISSNTYNFVPTGSIIDGWQRIVGEIDITSLDKYIQVALLNSHDTDVFFDDIRFLPYDGSMKSFVYSEENNRLMAELDENNYATFYEYDAEGGLVRVKKETEKGVSTVQETRSSTTKR